MKAQQLTSQTGENALTIVDLPTPRPAANQVLIRVRAVSLNYRDLMVCDGRYGTVKLPRIPLSDGAGEVVEVGAEVRQWKVGDRVAGIFFQGWQDGPYTKKVGETALGGAIDGMLSEFVALNENGVVAIPAHLSFEEGATLPCAAVTAWDALVSQGQLQAGQTVLLLGTGGVSIFGLQFAKALGARAIILSSSDDKLARAKALGADDLINYRKTPEWERDVYRMTNKMGVDHVLEVGGAGTLQKSLRSLAVLGQAHVIGGVSGFSSEITLLDLISKMATIRGIYVGSRAMFEKMNEALTQHNIKPIVDKVFSFNEAVQVLSYLRFGTHFGKVVVTLD